MPIRGAARWEDCDIGAAEGRSGTRTETVPLCVCAAGWLRRGHRFWLTEDDPPLGSQYFAAQSNPSGRNFIFA